MANAHSHALGRWLRDEPTEPPYAEMAGAGYGAVGEFHYGDNDTAGVLADAARSAGIPLVLLPVAHDRYPTAASFLERVEELRAWAEDEDGVSVGVAAESASAVPAEWLEAIAAYSSEHGLVRHVHAAAAPRELEEVRAEHRCSPIELLEYTGFLGPLASVVHAIHVSRADVELLSDTGTTVISCPTSEANRGDEHPPLGELLDARVPVALGSDWQVRIDPFEEARGLFTLGRRQGRAERGDLWAELCRAGVRALGLPDTGEIELDLEHPDLRGVDRADLPLALVTCASAGVVSRPAVRQTPPRGA